MSSIEEQLVDRETKLNSLKEEYNLFQSKRNILQDHKDIIKELIKNNIGYM
jgi:hypothetical protein